MELKIKEAFERLNQKSDSEEIMRALRFEWESEKSREFNPVRNNRQIALLLIVSPTLRSISGFTEELDEFERFVEEVQIALKAKLDRNPHGAALASSIGNFCRPMNKEEAVLEPHIAEAARVLRTLTNPTPF